MVDYEALELSRYRLSQAKDCLRAAENNLASELYKDSLNRSYYCIFHSMRAVLALDMFDSKKHSGIIANFRQKYIKTGVFNPTLSDIIGSAFEVRNNSDYEDFYVVAKEDVDQQINNAKEFMSEVVVYIDSVAATNSVSIVIDKLDAISKAKVVGRPKDLYDLYVVSLLYEFEFIEIHNHPDFKISGDFENFIEDWEKIAEAYKVSDIIAKGIRPDFDDLYIRVKEFASPFIVSEELLTQNLKWNIEKGAWVSNEKSSGLIPSNVFADKRKVKE